MLQEQEIKLLVERVIPYDYTCAVNRTIQNKLRAELRGKITEIIRETQKKNPTFKEEK